MLELRDTVIDMDSFGLYVALARVARYIQLARVQHAALVGAEL